MVHALSSQVTVKHHLIIPIYAIVMFQACYAHERINHLLELIIVVLFVQALITLLLFNQGQAHFSIFLHLLLVMIHKPFSKDLCLMAVVEQMYHRILKLD